MFKIKSFFRKLGRVISAIPVIWNCEEWDYSYTLDLLKWRFERCAKYFERSNIAHQDIRSVKELRDVVEAIKEYNNPSYKEHPFKISHVFVPTDRKTSRVVTINKDTGKSLTKEEEEVYTNYLSDCCKYEEECWNNIWDNIKQHGQGWWN